MNIMSILLAAVSAYYFGWVKGQDDAVKGIKPGEIVIDGTKIVLPQNVYEFIKGTVGTGTAVEQPSPLALPKPAAVKPFGE